MRWVLRSKIHKATVTEADVNYVGSVTIDEDLMDRVGLWPGEKVLIVTIRMELGSRRTRSPGSAGQVPSRSTAQPPTG